MKRLIILASVLILALSLSSVSAGWFGPDTIECKQFSIEIPEGYYKSAEWTDNVFDDFIYIWSDADDNEPERDLMMFEVSSFDSFNRSDSEQIIDSYTDNGITIEKCFDPNEIVVFRNGDVVYGSNYTHAEFTKDGHNYVVIIEFKGDINDINMEEDIKLINNIRETTTPK